MKFSVLLSTIVTASLMTMKAQAYYEGYQAHALDSREWATDFLARHTDDSIKEMREEIAMRQTILESFSTRDIIYQLELRLYGEPDDVFGFSSDVEPASLVDNGGDVGPPVAAESVVVVPSAAEKAVVVPPALHPRSFGRSLN